MSPRKWGKNPVIGGTSRKAAKNKGKEKSFCFYKQVLGNLPSIIYLFEDLVSRWNATEKCDFFTLSKLLVLPLWISEKNSKFI